MVEVVELDSSAYKMEKYVNVVGLTVAKNRKKPQKRNHDAEAESREKLEIVHYSNIPDPKVLGYDDTYLNRCRTVGTSFCRTRRFAI